MSSCDDGLKVVESRASLGVCRVPLNAGSYSTLQSRFLQGLVDAHSYKLIILKLYVTFTAIWEDKAGPQSGGDNAA